MVPVISEGEPAGVTFEKTGLWFLMIGSLPVASGTVVYGMAAVFIKYDPIDGYPSLLFDWEPGLQVGGWDALFFSKKDSFVQP